MLWCGNEIKLQDLRLLAERQLRLLKVKGWGLLYGMRVLDGPLNVFLKVKTKE